MEFSFYREKQGAEPTKNPNFFKIETSKSRFVNSIFIFFGYDTEKDEVV